MIEIVHVENKTDLDLFIQLPYDLYKDNKYWAPPIKSDERSYLTDIPQIDPGIETKMFLAKNNTGEVVGRMQIIINYHEIEFSGEKVGRFNKIDFIKDIEVCRSLLKAGEDWARSKEIKKLIGPFGYTNLDAAGLLTEGFEELSNASTIYNFPYYRDFIVQCGYKTYLKWLEHEFTVPNKIPEKIIKFSELVRNRYNLHYASFNSKNEKLEQARQIIQLINICYAHLPGFVPLSKEIKDYYFKKYIPMINKEYISLVNDQNGKLIGFGLTLPSYTKALQKAKGLLFPFGFYYLWNASRYNDRAEMLLIAIHPDYQQKGITSIIFEKILKQYIKNGIKKVESNPEQENNMNVRNLWKEYKFRLHKKRICYYKDI
ncbi:GNAT family N-acetyltransferase [Membranihabitans maritimus]|uniref:GNAT family N-acetyltransferase n=1 Tax=Membranihabitans maritimus TaxID=2904244 RepID=UPI001F3D900D|nr:GNAT family N-acetyltransferase [Membranihabitans maritimus]